MAQIQIGSWIYEQIQINGQRITTNLAFKNCLMAERNPTEVFISRIPFTMYEDNIIPLFDTVGVVMQLRLMMNYSTRNRGFGYVVFLDRNDAYRAIACLDNILLSSYCRLKLSISKNVRTLCLTGVSDHFDVDGIINLVLGKVDPLEISICLRRGQPCFLLKFSTHRDAAISRKTLLGEIIDFGPSAQANWNKH